MRQNGFFMSSASRQASLQDLPVDGQRPFLRDHALGKEIANQHEISGSLTKKTLVSKICLFVMITFNTQE
jgi:hypothetical protein